jgi:hypothetical protein
MDIKQIIELWTSLSPHLTRAIPGDEPSKDKHTNKKKSDGDGKDEIVDLDEGHLKERDVWKRNFKCLLIPVILSGC